MPNNGVLRPVCRGKQFDLRLHSVHLPEMRYLSHSCGYVCDLQRAVPREHDELRVPDYRVLRRIQRLEHLHLRLRRLRECEMRNLSDEHVRVRDLSRTIQSEHLAVRVPNNGVLRRIQHLEHLHLRLRGLRECEVRDVSYLRIRVRDLQRIQQKRLEPVRLPPRLPG